MTLDGELKRDAAFAGQRVKPNVVFALALCSVIPLLVLAYVFYGNLVLCRRLLGRPVWDFSSGDTRATVAAA